MMLKICSCRSRRKSLSTFCWSSHLGLYSAKSAKWRTSVRDSPGKQSQQKEQLCVLLNLSLVRQVAVVMLTASR